MIENIHEFKECPDCASSNIVYDERREQLICRECGLIYEPLTPEVEEEFESSHNIITGPPKKSKPAKKAPKKAAKKPAKKKKK